MAIELELEVAGAARRRRGGTLLRYLPRGDSLPDDVWLRRHRFLSALLLLHALALPWFAVISGRGLLHAIAVGALVPAAATGAALAAAGNRKLAAACVALGLLTSSAVIVHLSGGYIEAHFHFFIVVVMLGLYEDWVPFGLALAYVVLHHGLVGVVDAHSVFNHAAAERRPWLWAGIHGLAIGAAGALSLASWRLNEELRLAAGRALAEARAHQEELELRTAQLAAVNERLDRSYRELERANRELRELDRLKSEFVTIASHELRTPLTSIFGFATTLGHRWDEIPEDKRREYVGIVEEQADRLRRLVQDLLEMSRIEAGSVRVDVEHVDLPRAIDRAAAGFPDAEVRVECAPGLEVRADPDHVQQILVNYLGNALKYGAPPVVVEAERVAGKVEVRVRDAGAGVPEEFVPRLFEKFSQANGANGGSGSGLGLAIVRGLAEANGGEAWYEPPRGHGGACFAVRLPG